ncbi:MAG: hypothetical protein HQL87_17805, partial [Magnetococcales bacterium]|nr:hypothetical protein [Magnetococcales bacterium]
MEEPELNHSYGAAVQSNIDVNSTGATAVYADVSTFAAPGADPATTTINPSVLDGLGTNVALQAKNNIVFTSPLTLTSSGKSLTARAGNNIIVNAAISTTGGDINLTANDPGGIPSGTGSIVINAPLNTANAGVSGGNIALTVSGGTGNIQLGNNLSTLDGTIALTAPIAVTNDVTLSSGLGQINLGNVTMTDAKTLTVGTGAATPILLAAVDNTTTANSSNLTINTTDAVTVSGTVGGTNALNTLTITASSSTGFGVVRTGKLVLTDALGSVAFTSIAGSGGVPYVPGASITVGSGGGDITIGATEASQISGILGAGTSVGLNAATAININSTIDVSGVLGASNKSLSFAAHNLNIGIGVNVGTNDGTLTFTGDVNFLAGATPSFATNGGILSIIGKTILGGDLTITAGSGDVTFSDTVDGGYALIVNSTGATVFNAAVGGGVGTALTSLTTNAGGSVSLKSVTTTGAQTYHDDTATLNGTYTTTANGAFVVDGNTTLAGPVTVSTGSGGVTFTGTVDGTQTLLVNSTGATVFNAAVGGGVGTALTSLTTNAGGSVSLKSVTTSGVQSYGEDATLNGIYTTTDNAFGVAGNTTLAGPVTVSTGSGGVTFTGTVDGAQTLLVNSTGATVFNAAVGGGVGTALTSLTTNAGGSLGMESIVVRPVVRS